MFKQLIEDHRKREEEVAAEWATRKREVKLLLDAMNQHMEKLMRVVEDSKKAPIAIPVCELGREKLVPLSESNDIEAYLLMFERIMKAHKIEKERWAHYLAPWAVLQMPAVHVRLAAANSGEIKAAVLQQYHNMRRRTRNASGRPVVEMERVIVSMR